MKISKVILAFLILCLISINIFAQEDNSWQLWKNGVGKPRWLTYHLEKEDVLKMTEKWNKIGKTIENSSNEFAGTYFNGGFSGYFLRWTPEGGFIFIEYFDEEHPCYFSYGDVSENGVEINFAVKFESKVKFCPSENSTPKVWIPAEGGKYFIQKKNAQEFADFYAGFGEYNGLHTKDFFGQTYFALKWIKDFQPKKDFILPKGFEIYVRKPITAKIISVGKTKSEKGNYSYPFDETISVTPVKIDAGRKQNVKKDMEFRLLNSDDDFYQTLQITKVGENTSDGKVIRKIHENGKEGYDKYDEEKDDFVFTLFTPISKDSKVTTSPIVDF